MSLNFGSILAYSVKGDCIGTAFGIMGSMGNLTILIVTQILFCIKDNSNEKQLLQANLMLLIFSLAGLISSLLLYYINFRDDNLIMNYSNYIEIIKYYKEKIDNFPDYESFNS